MSAPVAVSIVAGTLALGAFAMQATASLEARHAAAALAENAALAAADAQFGWVDETACDAAALVVTAYATESRGAPELVSCETAAFEVRVSVRIDAFLGASIGRARAGVPEALRSS